MATNEPKQDNEIKEEPKLKPIIDAADHLSLGISIVVAIAMGVGIGYVLKSWTGASWTMFIGIFIGVAAAIMNIYKAYSKQYKDMQDLAKQPRYAMKKQIQDDEDDEDYGETKY
jgi:F0F1-type ATP synthase assembly protein I